MRDLTFTPSGATVLFVEIQLIDDPFFEGREKFTLQLEANQPRIILGPDRTSVSIVDNEGNTVNYASVSQGYPHSSNGHNIIV